MIGTFKSWALKRYRERNDARAINPRHLRRVRTTLSILQAGHALSDIKVPGYYLHKLEPRTGSRYSLRVTSNRRIEFDWIDGVADQIDYGDYH